MSIKKLLKKIKYGGFFKWASDFTTQIWSNITDVTGGYGGWSAGSGYMPRINYNNNGIIQWQSTTNWYYGYIINHFVGPILSQMVPTYVEGNLYGYMTTSYHTQTTSYNYFTNNANYMADETSTYTHIRTTTGLSFTICSYGGYYGSYTQAKAYLNGILIGTIGSISNCSTDYSLKFKLIGRKLYAYFGAGDLRNNSVAMTLISDNVDNSALTGKGNIIFMSSWITNDQGESCYGEVRSSDVKNYN